MHPVQGLRTGRQSRVGDARPAYPPLVADFFDSTAVDVSERVLFDYLSTVANLPRYLTRMISAEPGDGDEVRTTVGLPDGEEVRGASWFRVDRAAQRIEWGSEGPSGYRGRLAVTSTSGTVWVDVHVHTTRVADGDPNVQHGVDDTVATIKKLVEEGGVG